MIGNRLKQLRKNKGYNMKQMASALNLPYTTYVNYEKGEREPNSEQLILFSKYFDVSIDYIIGITDNVKHENNIEVLPNSKIHMIPVFETVSAGFGAYANDCIIDYMPLYIANISDVPDMMCIKVTGDSMYPKIEDGDIVVVRRQPIVDNGQIAVVLIDGEEGVVKKINAGKDFIELISINPMYPPRRFENEETERLRIVGLVKQIIKNI